MRWIEENTPGRPPSTPFSPPPSPPFCMFPANRRAPAVEGAPLVPAMGLKKRRSGEERGRAEKGGKKDCGPAENSNVNDSSNRAPNLVRYRKFVDFYSPCPPSPFFPAPAGFFPPVGTVPDNRPEGAAARGGGDFVGLTGFLGISLGFYGFLLRTAHRSFDIEIYLRLGLVSLNASVFILREPGV